MPSRQEGFGIVYVEAMRHGLPIIASVHDAGQEVNMDQVTGFNIDLDRPGELAERVILLLRDANLAQWMGIAAAARWREHFAWTAFRKRLEPILAEFLRR
jgi:phosphatidylinositol alpha-1,6-mannosyltransferase